MQFSLTNQGLNSMISTSDETASIIHIWGDIGVGKTTMCYSCALSKLAQGKKVVYVNTKSPFNSNRFKQIMQNYPPFDEYNFILYNPTTFSQQTEILMNLEFLILEEINTFHNTSVGLIILDDASILRHLELKTKEYNQKMLRVLNTTIASLDFIRKTYEIPVLITNRSVIRVINDQNFSQPASNAIMEYWAKYRIHLERTTNPVIREVVLEAHPMHSNLPIRIQTQLNNNGFV